jgi:hypothetical protein
MNGTGDFTNQQVAQLEIQDTINDLQASVNGLYSSAQIQSFLSNKIDISQIADGATGVSQLWSASYLNTVLDQKVRLIVISADPLVTSDTYPVGSIWVNSATQDAFICTNNTTLNAVWKNFDIAENTAHRSDDSKHRTINDNGTSATDLLSASKITTLLNSKAGLSHSHAISEIVNLEGSLNAKANLSHTHSMSNIAGLNSTVLALQSRAEKGSNGGYPGLDASGLIAAVHLPAPTAHTHTVAEITDFAANIPIATVSGRTGSITLYNTDVGLGLVRNVRNTLHNGPPGVYQDNNSEYYVGTIFNDVLNHNTYISTDDSNGAAVWELINNSVTSVSNQTGAIILTSSDVGLGNVLNLKSNNAIVDPGISNDTSQGYANGSFWYNTSSQNVFTCVDAANGIWKSTTTTPFVEMNDLTNVSGALTQNAFPLYDGISEFKMTNILSTIQNDTTVSANSAHRQDNTLHFTEGSIDHGSISNIGTNTHAQIDTHLSDASIHFTEASIDHINILNKGTNTHAQIDTHLADDSKHRMINDAGTTNIQLFSANKIIADLTLKTNQSDFDLLHARIPDGDFTLTKVQDVESLPSTYESRSIAFNGSSIYIGGTLDASYGNNPMIRRFDFNVLHASTGEPLTEDINLNTLSGKVCTSVESLKVFGNWLFVINPEAGSNSNTTGMGVHVFDIANSGLVYNTAMSNALTGLGSSFWDSEVVGSYLYIKIGSNLRTYSLINPVPVLIHTLATGANYRQLYSDGQYLYNFFVPDGCRIFDIGNGIPVLVGDLVIPGNTIRRVLGVLRDGNKLYVTQTNSFSSENRLWVLDISSSITSPGLFAQHTYDNNTIPRKLSLCGTSIFVAKTGSFEAGFHILDANITTSNLVSGLLTEKMDHTADGAIFAVEMFGDRIYALNYSTATLHEFKHSSSFSYAGAKICSIVSEQTNTGILNAAKINCMTSAVFGNGITAGGDSLIDGNLYIDGDTTLRDIYGKAGQTLSLRNALNNASIELNASGNKITLYSDLVECKLDLVVNGNLTVSGTTTTINTTELDVEDSLIKVANGNVANNINSGFYTTYNNGQQRFDGLMRYHGDGDHYLIGNVTVEPTNTTDLSTLTKGNLKVKDIDVSGILRVGIINQDSQSSCFAAISKDFTTGTYTISVPGVIGNMITRYGNNTSTTPSSIQVLKAGVYEVRYELCIAPGASSLLTKSDLRKNGVVLQGVEGFYKGVVGVTEANSRTIIVNCNANDVFDIYMSTVPSTLTLFSAGLIVKRMRVQ